MRKAKLSPRKDRKKMVVGSINSSKTGVLKFLQIRCALSKARAVTQEKAAFVSQSKYSIHVYANSL